MIPTIKPELPQPEFTLKHLLLMVPWKFIFQRLPGTCLLLVIPLTVFGPAYSPFLFSVYFLVLHLFYMFNYLRTAYATYIGYSQSKVFSTTDWVQKYMEKTGACSGSDTSHDLPFDSVLHTIIIPNYKEDLGTLGETLDILASHSRALTQYRICLAMEESEQGSVEKAKKLVKDYQYLFFDIRYTIHPINRPGEIRGKSSNVAWASQQMALLSHRHDHEILTVMDADTAFSADYFMACSYFYCVAPPSHRRLMMFAPCTVFDRNANQVPIFVRGSDLFWSINVMSNLFPGSPVKIPCSAYSISMNLVLAVNFWDAGPEAIGEDMHMYLKCFFHTQGKVIVKSIFSPSSNCNIEGSGSGVKGYVSNLFARYTQAKRHMWGSLDYGYTLRRAILAQAGVDEHINTDVYSSKSKDFSTGPTIKWSTLFHLFLVLTECHMLPGQLFMMLTLISFFAPVIMPAGQVHWAVLYTLQACGWVRFGGVVMTAVAAFFYEKYHHWVSTGRWKQQELQNLSAMRRDYEPQDELLGSETPRVQELGKRPTLYSPRSFPRHLPDFFATIISGFFFGCLPQLNAQLLHFFTDRLDYKVAQKPVLDYQPLVVEEETKSVSSVVSKGDEGFFEEERVGVA
ncbi:glycosyl transferase family group 2-domain-containing protein [Gorgonomyces haynaldii]|nr:glycosyl transferase family group 2-domain-containing protein [Gorgonomyces haynaldii]